MLQVLSLRSMAKILLTSVNTETISTKAHGGVFWAPWAVWVDAGMGVPLPGPGLLTVHQGAHGAVPWGTEQGWLCPTSQELPTFTCTYPAGCDLSKSKKTPKINLSNSWIFHLCSQLTRQFPHTPAAGKSFPSVQLLEEISVAAVFPYRPILTSP